MNVWIVTVGERYEGDSIVCLFSEENEEGARRAAAETMDEATEASGREPWQQTQNERNLKEWKGKGLVVRMELYEVFP